METMQKQIHFSSKADVLSQLLDKVDLYIPPIYIIYFATWQRERERTLAEAFTWAQDYATPLAVRSSCLREDAAHTSAAGAFTSCLHIPYTSKQGICTAIDDVFASYGKAMSDDQAFLQTMVTDIAVSGVIMTRALHDGSPYYVINYDDESGKTDTITGGRGTSKTVYVYRGAQDSDFDSQRLLAFVRLAKRVEKLCKRSDLDIEFCQGHDGCVHLLQVRPICSQHQWVNTSDEHVKNNIDFIAEFVSKRTKPWPNLFGHTSILGVMPDWNPAEIIGVTPRPLATSLYRELITQNVWRQAREHMGYTAIPPEELMIMLAGRPYIDVRVSFNSFLPRGVDSITGETLVSAWLEYLDMHPHLHDKIEFDVAQTILDFSFDTHLKTRYPNLLSRERQERFRQCLQVLTNNCLSMDEKGSVEWAFDAIAELCNRQVGRGAASFEHMQLHAFLPHIQLLCEECKRFGTLPFSVLARHAFIAETLLRTAVERGALCAERLVDFKKSLHTVAGEMSHDFLSVYRGSMGREAFVARYGHLRPSTYDILSPRYADRTDLFMENGIDIPAPQAQATFVFTAEEEKNISHLMQETGLCGDSTSLMHYARKVIPGREWAKFIFSKNLSAILELIAHWGEKLHLDRDTLSFLDLRHIVEWSSHSLLQEPRTYFENLAHEGRHSFSLSQSLKLGYLIRSERDVYIVPQHRSAPNFIGKGHIESRIVSLHAHSDCSVDITGALVCIENADPGFDWIFTRNIAGLITMFGGTNSHMAIRCAEYGLPAAIGVGENLFEKISQAKRCLLNAGTCTLQAL